MSLIQGNNSEHIENMVGERFSEDRGAVSTNDGVSSDLASSR